MGRPHRQTISRQLYLLVIAAVATAVLAATGLSVWQATHRYLEAKKRELFAIGEVFSAATASAVSDNDSTQARDALRAMGRIEGVLHARIVTRSGTILASMGTAAQLDSDARIISKDAPIGFWPAVTSRSLQVSVAIVEAGTPIGELVLVGSTSDLTANLASIALLATLGGLGAMAIGLMVATRLQRRITGPLAGLVNFMSHVRSTHNYSGRADVKAGGEIGVLIDSFNMMLGEIGERDHRLARHRETLEREVRDRTQDLRIAMDAAEAANSAKSEFLATMSHEIRTPMNGIMVMAELLAAGELPARQQRYAEVIAKSGQSLLAIINDILDFSKIEAGRLELELVELDPAELADDVVSLFTERAQSKGLDLAAYVSPDAPRRIIGDPVRLNQILSNLINNALKFTERGYVILTIESESGKQPGLHFAVRDTGIGIIPEKVEGIFSAFSQADQSTTRKFGGTGLGLTICRRLLQAMGSQILVDSVPGEGSTFHFSLPVMLEQLGTIPRATPLHARSVIIDVGAPATRLVLARHLAARGLQIMEAQDEIALGAASLIITEAERAERLAQNLGSRAATTVVVLARMGDSRGENLVARQRALATISHPVLQAELLPLLAKLVDGIDGFTKRPRLHHRSDDLPRFEGVHVLVADDSPVNREVVLEALSRLGATADMVENGAKAVAAVVQGGYELVLMDGSMPEMDGFEAARRIRQIENSTNCERLPIIALTAHVVGAGADAWREAGMDDVVYKPFSLRALAESIARLLPVRSTSAARARNPASTEPPASDCAEAIASPQLLTGTQNPPLLDEEVTQYLENMSRNGQDGFVERVFNLYLDHAPAGFSELCEATDTEDSDRIARAAHALKSMSSNIGAARVALAAAEIERTARVNEPIGPTICESLGAVIAETLQEIRRRLGSKEETASIACSECARPGADTPTTFRGKLTAALARGEFQLVYQPIVERSTNQAVGVEALLRWRGGSSPSEFIPLAESSGEICAIGEWAMLRACEEAAGWPHLSLAVNVSPVQLQQDSFSLTVEKVLAQTGFPPHRLELEITETALLKNEHRALATIKQLRERGIKFALDDFGTGFSSLTYLRVLPVDKIKIDRSFVINVDQMVDAATIVHAVVSIGRALGKKIVAEGVETEEQRRFLAAAGVHMFQGYFYARPMAGEQLSQWLMRNLAPMEVAVGHSVA